MYFKPLSVLFFSFLFLACSSGLDRAMKSEDKDLMIKTAQELYDKRKYDEAVLLYDKVSSLLTTVEETSNVTYKTAEANMAAENYVTAAHQFSVFNVNYPTSPLAEEALYLSALCLYNLSPEFNLDPTHTQDAINRFQSFVNSYPDSKKVADATKKIEELREKLERKAYDTAMLHYKIINYKSSSVDLKNFLDDYPDTKRKEEALYYIFMSDYNLSIKSIKEKKEERIKDALISYKKFSAAYPQSSHLKELEKLKEKLIEEQKQIIIL